MYQDRLLGLVDNDVRFRAIGGRTATTEFRAQSCRRFNPILGIRLRSLRSSFDLK